MKRYIFLVVAVALATVSCSKTYDTNRNANEGAAIKIGSWASGLTRARGAGGSSFANGDKFFVYAYTPTTATQFDGTVVSTEDGTTWTYSPVRYWNRDNAYYDFYAISPSEDVAANAIVASHTLATGVFGSQSLTLAGNDNDILIADKKHVPLANYGQDVQLNFRHINALFDLKVRKGSGIGNNGTLAITAVSLENIDKTGTFAVSGYSEAPADPVDTAIVTWTPTATGSYSNTSGAVSVATLPTNVTTDASSQYLINSLVVMPQAFRNTGETKQQLKISYTITTGEDPNQEVNTFTNKTYDLILFDKTDYPTDDNNGEAGNQYNDGENVSGWAAGVHYIYTITIDAEAINFTASVEPWGTENGYYYILN